ncbi:hypothetical protein EDD17DRAFT_1535452 [Pisolithus thermaeus]|nr:hypothetical protein EDD17DRAFT_1535452 [Pisolithus thermaeus]
MRLLDVVAVLDRERDIRTVDSEIGVTYDRMTGLAAMKPQKRDGSMERDGYQKIIKSCEQAKKGGYRWLWIDTCCIDRRSDLELLETIDSMYQRYHNSGMCYVYLHGDVNEPVRRVQRLTGAVLTRLDTPGTYRFDESQILSQGMDVHWHQRGTNNHVGGHHKDSGASVERQRGSEEV